MFRCNTLYWFKLPRDKYVPLEGRESSVLFISVWFLLKNVHIE